MTHELKPCPFCGTVPKLVEMDDIIGIECGGDCDTTGLCVAFAPHKRETAIAAWNRRAAQPTDAEVVAPPKRGYFVYDPDAGWPDFYDTDAERDAAHREVIKDYRDEALRDGEWSPSVDSIVSGIVPHKTVEIDMCGDQCDYAPSPAAPPSKPVDAEPVTRLETTSENIARDIREGRFPQRSEPQMVAETSDKDSK